MNKCAGVRSTKVMGCEISVSSTVLTIQHLRKVPVALLELVDVGLIIGIPMADGSIIEG